MNTEQEEIFNNKFKNFINVDKNFINIFKYICKIYDYLNYNKYEDKDKDAYENFNFITLLNNNIKVEKYEKESNKYSCNNYLIYYKIINMNSKFMLNKYKFILKKYKFILKKYKLKNKKLKVFISIKIVLDKYSIILYYIPKNINYYIYTNYIIKHKNNNPNIKKYIYHYFDSNYNINFLNNINIIKKYNKCLIYQNNNSKYIKYIDSSIILNKSKIIKYEDLSMTNYIKKKSINFYKFSFIKYIYKDIIFFDDFKTIKLEKYKNYIYYKIFRYTDINYYKFGIYDVLPFSALLFYLNESNFDKYSFKINSFYSKNKIKYII